MSCSPRRALIRFSKGAVWLFGISSQVNERHRSDSRHLSDTHKRRAELFGLYWDYYRGKHRRPLKIRDGQADDNVIVNYSRRVVDKSVAFLFGHPPCFEIEGDEIEAANDPMEEYLELVWGTDEQKAMLLQEMGIAGGVCGTAFVRLYPAEVPGALPRIAVLNPSLMDVVTNPDDIDQIVSYRIIWQSGDDWKRHRIDLQDNGTWVITEELNRFGTGTWAITQETVWPWTFAPVFWCQNRTNPIDNWGISDLEEADINDAINFVASDIQRILRYHAHPRTVGTGFTAAALQNTAVDNFWTIPAADAKVSNLEMQSDLASAYNMWSGLREAYAKITGVPDLDPSTVNVGALSRALRCASCMVTCSSLPTSSATPMARCWPASMPPCLRWRGLVSMWMCAMCGMTRCRSTRRHRCNCWHSTASRACRWNLTLRHVAMTLSANKSASPMSDRKTRRSAKNCLRPLSAAPLVTWFRNRPG